MKFRQIVIMILMSGFVSHLGAGSLYQESSYSSLISDHTAMGIGDIVTVVIYENSLATANADDGKEKSFDLGVSANVNNSSNKLGISAENDYSTNGGTSRGGKIVANVTVRVIGKFDNGDLEISGEQLIEVNREKQNIKLSGRIRQIDISAQNTVLSTRVANAQIQYIGDGILGNGQSQGIITKIFDSLF